jgi:hypothetical protein
MYYRQCFQNMYRRILLRLAGYADVVALMDLQREVIQDLISKKKIKGAVCDFKLVKGKKGKKYLRMFFYHPDKILESVFLQDYASTIMRAAQDLVEGNFADVCKNKLKHGGNVYKLQRKTT